MAGSARPGPISARLLRRLQGGRSAGAVDLRAFRDGAAAAARLAGASAGDGRLGDLHPAHAAYVATQNHVSVLAEQLTSLPEIRELVDVLAAAEDEYMPSGPPMSPLTVSYFTCWAFFDAAVGARRETLGTCILSLGAALGTAPPFLALVDAMQRSSMGVYVHEGRAGGDTSVLRDVVSGTRTRCLVPSGWRGATGELWLARVLPPPSSAFEISVVFTTPYVLRRTTEQDWLAYFERALGPARGDAKLATEGLKHGIDWSEYIFAGYADHAHEAVFLEGLPDVPASLPHYSPRGPGRT